MSEARRYRLLCPIARALDAVGDRWALLLLRDLHAGPARFGELLDGLTGIASNLLASRLDELAAANLIHKTVGPHQVAVYELTSLGVHTANLLYELAAFGSRLPPDGDVRPPGNRRTIAVTLKVACARVVDPSLALEVELRVDGEPFALRADRGRVDVWARPAVAPQVVLATDYESLVDVTDGVLRPQDFARRVAVTSTDPVAVKRALGLLAAAIERIARDAPAGARAAPAPRRPRRRRKGA